MLPAILCRHPRNARRPIYNAGGEECTICGADDWSSGGLDKNFRTIDIARFVKEHEDKAKRLEQELAVLRNEAWSLVEPAWAEAEKRGYDALQDMKDIARLFVFLDPERYREMIQVIRFNEEGS